MICIYIFDMEFNDLFKDHIISVSVTWNLVFSQYEKLKVNMLKTQWTESQDAKLRRGILVLGSRIIFCTFYKEYYAEARCVNSILLQKSILKHEHHHLACS